MLPIAAVGDVVVLAEPARVVLVRDRRADFLRRPDKEFALHAFGVGIGRGVEPAFR